MLIYMNKNSDELSVSSRLGELYKGKVQLGNPKVVAVALWELFITKFKSQFKRGFTKMVVTRAGRLREWSQGEL